MANKQGKQDAQAPRQMTRGQLSRHQQELLKTRQLTFAIAGIGVLLVLILGAALFTQYVYRPNISVGKVNNTTITRSLYNKFRSWQIYNQMRILQFYANQATPDQATQYTSQITPLQTELQGIETWPTIDAPTLSQLADNLLMEQQAGTLGVSVTDDEVRAAAQKNFEPQPTAIPTLSPTVTTTSPPGTPDTATVTPTTTPTGAAPTVTSTATGTPASETPTVTRTPRATFTPGASPTASPTATITSTPLPVAGAEKTAVVDFSSFIKAIAGSTKPGGSSYCSLGCPNLSESDYLQLVAKPDELKKRITDKLGETVPKQREEVHVQHILVANEALARDLKARLDKGADFAALAQQYSTDTSNADTGGDLGWFASTENGGPMDQTFSTAAFKLTQPGQIGDPVQTQFGWHILRLVERGQRDLSKSDLDTAKSKAFDAWLKKQKDAAGPNIVLTVTVPPTATPVPTEAPATATATPAAGATAAPAGTVITAPAATTSVPTTPAAATATTAPAAATATAPTVATLTAPPAATATVAAPGATATK
ncbi:MAG: peptidylprolyl isomerase [Chloroflexota bacterium]|nr:peptidylprolyl isomerase [Chloroflexota bacterium]